MVLLLSLEYFLCLFICTFASIKCLLGEQQSYMNTVGHVRWQSVFEETNRGSWWWTLTSVCLRSSFSLTLIRQEPGLPPGPEGASLHLRCCTGDVNTHTQQEIRQTSSFVSSIHVVSEGPPDIPPPPPPTRFSNCSGTIHPSVIYRILLESPVNRTQSARLCKPNWIHCSARCKLTCLEF